MTILDLFDAALADGAERLAVGHLSYREFDLAHRRVARGLIEGGLRKGERLGIYAENSLGFVLAYFGALRAGLTVVPANVLYRATDLSHVLGNAGAAAVVASRTSREHVEALAEPYPLIEIAQIDRWAADEALAPAGNERAPAADDLALIVYTSGTTGRSKGAMVTHGNIAANAAQLIAAWRWSSEDTLLIALPLFHIHGLIAALSTSLCSGGRIVVHERFEAKAVLQAMSDQRATMFFGVPTMYVRLLEALGDRVPPKLRLFVSGSAALAPDVFAAFRDRFGSHILERLGATECGFVISNRYGGPRVPGSVGVPLPASRAQIVDVETLAPVGPGEVGELCIAGPTVFPGYWQNPEATAAAFALDAQGTRWYRMGDLARFDPEQGVYEIVGRLKELIISGGFNIYPREVETEIDRFPGVRASAVIGISDPARGELPVAFVECERAIEAEALLGYLSARIASFKIPKAVHFVDALPRNALGKIEKQRLKERVPR